ncbi:hypothetical protein GF385_02780 [Candidatus Dependentiae bacterium]|nr:hypothetical protein [Candidatus Dependentiae bacterium]
MKKFLSIILFLILSLNSNIKSINVITNNAISKQEKTYIKKRKSITNQAIKDIIGSKIKNLKLPKISLCFSGGGYRSMISCLGFLNAADKNNLLDASTYISTLSGSTWLMIPLLIRNIIPHFYKKILETEVNHNFFNPETLDIKTIVKYLKKKKNIQLIDIWGSVLADRLLGNIENCENLSFKQIRKNLSKKNYYPFPLFSCVIANSRDPKTDLPYTWLEVNPFQTFSKELGGSIQTKYFGSIFKNGKLKEKFSEKTAGVFMGIFGCPFCLSGGDIFNFALEMLANKLKITNYFFLDWFEKKFEILGLYKKRFCPAKIPNYSYNLKQSKLRKTKTLQLIDGGFSFNLPVVPLFRRKTDIIIICDASSDSCNINYPELRLVSNYAKKHHNICLPNIEKPYKKFDNLYIFFDEYNSDVPMIIYFTNPISDPTLKLKYDPEEFDYLHDTMKKIVENNHENIINAITLKTKQLNQ